MNNNNIIKIIAFSSIFISLFSFNHILQNFSVFSKEQDIKKMKEEDKKQEELQKEQERRRQYYQANKDFYEFINQTPTERKQYIANIPEESLSYPSSGTIINNFKNGSNPIAVSPKYNKDIIFENSKQTVVYLNSLNYYVKNNAKKTVLKVDNISYRLENQKIQNIGEKGNFILTDNNPLFPFDTLIKTDKGLFSLKNTVCPLPQNTKEITIINDKETNSYYMFPVDNRSINCNILRLPQEEK